ncbi:unnamed protein product, partial [Gongylonema pulchrum]|uniref:ADH_N domain-containing protein n=1 Tax=Gongylonema pulchrum TaxID=637853 RepID=A0A183EQT8_9BILA
MRNGDKRHKVVPVEGGIVISGNGDPKRPLGKVMFEFMPPMEECSYCQSQSERRDNVTNEIGMVLVGGTGASVFHQIDEVKYSDFGVDKFSVTVYNNYSETLF